MQKVSELEFIETQQNFIQKTLKFNPFKNWNNLQKVCYVSQKALPSSCEEVSEDKREKITFAARIIRFFEVTWQTLKIIKMAISALICYIANRFTSGCIEIARALFCCKIRISCNGFVKTNHSVDPSKEKYEVNKGLMADISARHEGEESQKTAEFLAANFFEKNAPTQMDILNKVIPNIERHFDVGEHCPYHYHRYGFIDNPEIGQEVNKKVFALAEESPFIPTDTIEFCKLYSLGFETASGLKFPLPHLFSHFRENREDPLSVKLERPIIFDLTDRLSEKMSKKDQDRASNELENIKTNAEAYLEFAVESLMNRYPQYSKNQIKNWLKKSCVFICRVKDPDSSLCGIKMLPVFYKMSKGRYIKNYSSLVEFISNTGLFIGGVNLRRYLWTRPLEVEETRFIKDSKGEYAAFINYFRNQNDILNSPFLIKIKKTFEECPNPHYQALGIGITQLIDGLLREVTDEKWGELQADGVKNEVIQTSIYCILVELSFAQMAMGKNDFDEFSQRIELAHAQLANLLEVIRPFEQEQYAENYLEMLGEIPGVNSNYVKPGLCKTGMNAFAAIASAIAESTDRPVRAYGKGFYFEQAGFIGYDNSLETILNDHSIEAVDLYACQFFPNLEIASDFTHYEKGRAAEDIREILSKKPKTQHLTVAVDCTIDYIHSESMKELLQEFKGEIADGTLNFVFFRSGQKLDQFGMDSYYGAPFVQVNNNAGHWKPFDNIHQDQAFRTDPLSLQWFALAFTYAAGSMDLYRKLIFDNARAIIDQLPKRLEPSDDPVNQPLRVNAVSVDMLPSFIDIKLAGPMHSLRAHWILARFYEQFNSEGYKINTRASFGFIQPNFVIIQINEVSDSTTIRLNPGINPEQNELIVKLIADCVYRSN